MLDQRIIECKEKYEGQHYFTLPNKDGYRREFVILQYVDAKNVLIQFVGTDYQMKAPMHSIMTKGIRDPFETENSCVVFENNYKKYIGCYFRTNEGYYIQIIDYITVSDVTIQFVHNGLVVKHCTIQNIKNGQIKNPYHPNKFGGYTGCGPYSTNEYRWLYRIWYNILIRSTDQSYYQKYHNTTSYSNTALDPSWLSFDYFARWYMSELSKLNQNFNYDIDKDLLYPYYKNQTNGKKYYSSQTCVLVPEEINAFLAKSNLAKENWFESKEEYNANLRNKLFELANKYYGQGALSETAFQALRLHDVSVNLKPFISDNRLQKNLDKAVNKKLNQINKKENS